MTLALDHVYVLSEPGAPEAAALAPHGFAIGRRREHPGQGTANACLGFADSMLEFLWLSDLREAKGPLARPLQLPARARWRETGASPFGIALRTADPHAALPFPTVDYAPPYLPPGPPIRVAVSPAGAAEPLVFVVPVPYQPPTVAHPFAGAHITGLVLQLGQLAERSPLRGLLPGLLQCLGGPPLLAVTLDGGARGQQLDLRPRLPLRLAW